MITCLNMFPSKNGISRNLSPVAIILGSLIPYYNKLNIKFGAYAQVYIGNTDIIKQRSVGAITLIPVNKWGGSYFISLVTLKQLHDFIWIELPINDQVIYRVNTLETKENQPEMTKGYSIFEWIPGISIETQPKDNEIA